MAGSNHITKADLEELHQPKEGAAEKGCLTRHQPRTKNHQCSHQWQAGVKARSHWRLYEVPGYPQWSVLHEDNFEDFKVPYWHNAHHIIPSGALKTAIATAGRERAGLTNLIKQGLLKAEYNLNAKVNMVILPQKVWHAQRLRLPVHTKGWQYGDQYHEDYSGEAEEKLKPIVDDFKTLALEALKAVKGTHKKPDVKLSKKQLEELSESIYEKIRTIAKSPGNLGKSLQELSAQIFNFE